MNHAAMRMQFRLDEQSKTTLAGKMKLSLELQQIDKYQTFKDYGHHIKFKASGGYMKIRVHLIFDIKHDGRHRAQLVADEHLTDIPLDSGYSGVVSLRGFCLILFLAELNHLKLWAMYIGSAPKRFISLLGQNLEKEKATSLSSTRPCIDSEAAALVGMISLLTVYRQ